MVRKYVLLQRKEIPEKKARALDRIHSEQLLKTKKKQGDISGLHIEQITKQCCVIKDHREL